MNFVEKKSALIGRQTIYDNTKASKQVNIPLFSVDMDSLKAAFEKSIINNSLFVDVWKLKLNEKKNDNPNETNTKYLGWYSDVHALANVYEENSEKSLLNQLEEKINEMYIQYIDDLGKKSNHNIKLSVAALNFIINRDHKFNAQDVKELVSSEIITDLFVLVRDLEKSLKTKGIKRLELLRNYDQAKSKDITK
ncbi:TPA: hypothetical protein ACX6Q1_003800 [Photobacterium damselae]